MGCCAEPRRTWKHRTKRWGGGEEEEICGVCHRYSAGDIVNGEGRSALEMRASQLHGARGGRMSRCLHSYYKDLTHHCPDSGRPTTTNTTNTPQHAALHLMNVVRSCSGCRHSLKLIFERHRTETIPMCYSYEDCSFLSGEIPPCCVWNIRKGAASMHLAWFKSICCKVSYH